MRILSLRFAVAASLALSATLSSFASESRHVHMNILLNGSVVGENVFDLTDSAAFSSKTTLNIGVKVEGSISGHFKDDQLLDYISTTTGPTGLVKITLNKGELTIEAQGKATKIPFESKSGVWAGNLLPQFTSKTLLYLEKSIRSKPGVNEASVSAYLVDGGAAIQIKGRLLAARQVKVGGALQTARMFAVSLAGTDAVYAMDSRDDVVGMDVRRKSCA